MKKLKLVVMLAVMFIATMGMSMYMQGCSKETGTPNLPERITGPAIEDNGNDITNLVFSDEANPYGAISSDSLNKLGQIAALTEVGKGVSQKALGWQLYISVPFYSQKDPAWSGQLLGYNTSSAYTLGSHGCAVSCLAMLYTKWGYGASPSTINNWTFGGKAHYAFISGDGNLRFPQCLEYPGYICRPYQYISYNDIYLQVQRGRPVIIEIAYGSGSHFMIIFGFDGSRYWVKDPLRGYGSPDTPLYGSVRSARLWGYTK